MPLTIVLVILHAVSIPAMNLIIRIIKNKNKKKVVRMKSMWEWHARILERSTEWSDVGAISAFYMSDSYYSILRPTIERLE